MRGFLGNPAPVLLWLCNIFLWQHHKYLWKFRIYVSHFKFCFMRKKTDRIIFSVARFGLIISILGYSLSAMFAIITVSFNLSGKLWLNKNTWMRISEFGPGIPYHASLTLTIPDSSIVSEIAGASSLYNYYSLDLAPEQTGKQISLDAANYSDKILTDFKVYDGSSESKDIKSIGARLEKAVFHLQPSKFSDRIILSLPRILPYLLIAFCSWQLLQLVRAIHSGISFTESSSKRIAIIGWAIVVTALLLFILDLLQNSVSTISIDFSSTIPHYRMPFQVTAYKEGFSQLEWLFAGAIILLVAKAFSYGNQLQKYEDATI